MFRPERILTTLLFGLVAFAGIKIWSIEPDNARLVLSDGRGYYSYLPANIIYQDLQYDFLDEINQKYWENKPLDFIVETDGQTVNKYTAGLAVLWLPFFLIAHFLSMIMGWTTDGYASTYQISIAFSALVYLYLGLRFLVKVMREFKLKEWAISLSLLLIVLATNLLHYSLYEVSMSHVYSFFVIAAFLHHSILWLRYNGSLFWVAVWLGLIMLIRPTNVLVILLLPFLAGSWSLLKERILSAFGKPLDLVLSLTTGSLILSIQLVLYKAQTGSFLVDSYPGEGFNFQNPELPNVLFSFRKGLFIWSPLIMISVLGIFGVLRRSRMMALSVTLFLGAGSYLIAAWHMWYFGGSFGHRAFIDFYPVFAILLAFVFSEASAITSVVSAAIGICVFLPLNMVQTYQFNEGIIPFDGMDKKKYRQIWMKTDHSYMGVFDPYAWRSRYQGKDSVIVFHPLDSSLGWGNESQLTTELSHSGAGCAVMSENDMYGITLRQTMGDQRLERVNLVRSTFWAMAENEETTALLIISLQDSTGKSLSWQAAPIGLDLKGTGKWCKVDLIRDVPISTDPTDELLVYILKKEAKEKLYIDDLEIRLIDG